MDRVLHLPLPYHSRSPEDEEEIAAALVAALRNDDARARITFVARYGGHVRRVLVRLLGAHDEERADLLQETFARAFAGLDALVAPSSLKAWLTQIAVFAAREHLRRKRARRWLTFMAAPPETRAPIAGDDLREAARCVYEILDRVPADERLPLSLQAFEGMELEEVADACGMSYSTVRRRIERARRRFMKLAAGYEALTPWLEARR